MDTLNEKQDRQSTFLTDETRWEAVVRRDRSADGHFYYSVRTTGVYCRPSCAARLALRKNVAFHATRDDAERAGFRACLRCKPDQGGIAAIHAVGVATASRLIETAEKMPPLGELAAAAGMSRFHFHRVFKTLTGLTPKTYSSAHRAKRVREELKRANSVTDAIYSAGFNSTGRFYAHASDELGMSPTRFRSGGTGESIQFAVGECFMGSILVAKTGKGICAISLGEDPQALVEDLQDRFPKAALVRDVAEFERLVAQVVAFVESPGIGLNLPLDIRGTAFQKRVWKALQKIPAGHTVSYAQVARRIGKPGAIRAVAQACGTNVLAVAIPCHRAIRSDGELSGYRWGVERKRALLSREALQLSASAQFSSIPTLKDRIVTINWEQVAASLNADGYAVIGPILTQAECGAQVSMYPQDDAFRSRVVMARHGFGLGEYKYFSYPLPDRVATLREELYGPLVKIANPWQEAMGLYTRFPDDHAAFLRRCHRAGQQRPTPLLLQYGAGDYNCLHQDLYGEHVFPLQVAVLLSEPGRDFGGGEFVLTEQRPRMQTRASVVPLTQGSAVIFAVNDRPVQGKRGIYRVKMRHGVSRLLSGHRHTLGIIFHDAT
jgi:AraC family transcriptional regulator, regulatory protein of adaptative response / methylated-DNA-[protein]-cysteine methyltransferase